MGTGIRARALVSAALLLALVAAESVAVAQKGYRHYKKKVNGKTVIVIEEIHIERVPKPVVAVITMAPAFAVPAAPDGAAAELALWLEVVDAFERYDRALARHRGRVGRTERDAEVDARHRAARAARTRALLAALEPHGAVPEAMFVLAQLRAAAADDAADAAWDDASGEPPPEPDYAPALALWRRLAADHPDHALAGPAALLYGYYAAAMPGGDVARANQAMLGALCAGRYRPFDEPAPAPAPDAAFDGCAPAAAAPWTPEAIDRGWMLVGAYYFDVPGATAAARAAYSRVARRADAPARVPAMYMVAWSLYRDSRMQDAVNAFDEVARASDASGDGAVRADAIAMLAISFVEPWGDEHVPDPKHSNARVHAHYRGRWSEPHVRDVYVELGRAWVEASLPEGAIEAWRTALARWPLHAGNPVLHLKLVDALAQRRELAQAQAEIDAIVRTYGRGSAWRDANRDDAEAIASADVAVERGLMELATTAHQAAIDARARRREAEANALLRRAAELYTQLLEQYPCSQSAAEAREYRAMALEAIGDAELTAQLEARSKPASCE